VLEVQHTDFGAHFQSMALPSIMSLPHAGFILHSLSIDFLHLIEALWWEQGGRKGAGPMKKPECVG
jgi:hypothetical protein